MQFSLITIGILFLWSAVFLVSQSDANLLGSHNFDDHDNDDDDDFTSRAVQVVDKGILMPRYLVGAYQVSPSVVIVPKEMVEDYEPKYRHLTVITPDHEEHSVLYIWNDPQSLSKYQGKAILYIFNRELFTNAFEQRVKQIETLFGNKHDYDDDNDEDKQSESRNQFWQKFLARLKQRNSEDADDDREEQQSSQVNKSYLRPSKNLKSNLDDDTEKNTRNQIDNEFDKDSQEDDDSENSFDGKPQSLANKKSLDRTEGSEASEPDKKLLLLKLLLQRYHQIRQQQEQ